MRRPSVNTRGEVARKWFGAFACEEDGAVTVEAVLWIPFFFAVLMLITDVSLSFYARGQAFRIIQDGNRALSVRRFSEPEETEAWIADTYEPLSSGAEVDAVVSGGVVTTTMTIPLAEVQLFNTLSAFTDGSMSVTAEHYLE
jgi:hypothetical protein